MVKIAVERGESIGSLVEKIIAAKDEEIIVVVPRNADVKNSADNFRLLKKQADALKKNVSIESVDEEVIALAKLHELQALHPFFGLARASGTPQLSDIVSKRTGRSGRGQSAKPEKGKKKKTARAEEPPVKIHVKIPGEIREERQELEREEAWTNPPKPAEARPREESAAPTSPARIIKEPSFTMSVLPPREAVSEGRAFLGRRTVRVALGVLVVLAAGVLATHVFLGKAEVTVALVKTPWSYAGNVTADTEASGVDAARRLIPAALFTGEKNTTQLFPASDRREVTRKAKGTITIYNEFSAAPQALVATTRFLTPDGKLFRLDQRVTVPGARLVDGTLTPSHIEAAVTADRPGPEYNLSPVGRLSLPGFTGTPRYEKFYGELAQGTSGGFIGETAVPTTADIEAAKGKVGELLGTALRAELLANIPEGFVIVDGASEVTLARVNVNEATDEDGRFSVFGGATVAALAFREADMRNLLQEVSGKEHPLLVFHKLDLEYANVRANLKDGTVTFAVRAAADLAHPFSAEDFEASVLGRSVKEVKALIAGKEGIGGVAVSLRPFWRRSIPQNPERVTVGVE